ncbi:MAG: M3 family oligoendopeptidase [Gemmatimonadota bacterium]
MTWPTAPADLAAASWADLEPVFDELEARPLTTETAESWLADWSRFEEIVTEAISSAMIAYTCDTADAAKEAAHLRFSVDIAPKAEERSVRLAERIVRLGYSRPGLETMLARFRRSIEIFRAESVPVFSELEELSTRYQRITGGFLAEWDGEQKPLPQLAPFLQSRDRSIRERAFRAVVGPYRAAQPELASLFDEQFTRRQTVAKNADFPDFQLYSFAAKYRFDYTPADTARFHAAAAALVPPVLAAMYEERRDRLGLGSVRPWDLGAPIYRDEALKPFGTARELVEKAQRIFEHVDPVLGGQFQLLIDEQLLDLESRKGKAPGGYCDTLHFRGRPFIFMNASGVMEDVTTLLHEAGHAFHALASAPQPLIWQRYPTAESAELASMSMELLSAPLLGPPYGYLSERDAAIARLEHLEDVVSTLTHVASVDAFQQWLYTSGQGGDSAARDQAWLENRGRFERGVDWKGLEAERVTRWYRQLHIFLYPFYYIEYGIAQLGALQVWLNARRDQGVATAAYRRFLSRGATANLPELYAEAGAKLVFDEQDMGRLVKEVEREVEKLRSMVG